MLDKGIINLRYILYFSVFKKNVNLFIEGIVGTAYRFSRKYKKGGGLLINVQSLHYNFFLPVHFCFGNRSALQFYFKQSTVHDAVA